MGKDYENAGRGFGYTSSRLYSIAEFESVAQLCISRVVASLASTSKFIYFDLGCGSGFNGISQLQHVLDNCDQKIKPKAIFVDLSSDMCKRTRTTISENISPKECTTKVICGDIKKLPTVQYHPDSTVFILLHNILHFLSPTEIASLIGKFRYSGDNIFIYISMLNIYSASRFGLEAKSSPRLKGWINQRIITANSLTMPGVHATHMSPLGIQRLSSQVGYQCVATDTIANPRFPSYMFRDEQNTLAVIARFN